jgi:hypothetical protein
MNTTDEWEMHPFPTRKGYCIVTNLDQVRWKQPSRAPFQLTLSASHLPLFFAPFVTTFVTKTDNS